MLQIETKEGDNMTKSIISNEKECLICGTPFQLHKHHIFYGTANRKKSDADGCWCYLCYRHHNGSNAGVHYNHKLDMRLKEYTQKIWQEKYNKTKEEFIKRYGRNYL